MPVIHIRKAWTKADQEQAAADGWKLEPTHFKDKYNRYKVRWFITSIDETKTDEQTINHVVMEAGKGFPLYLKAIFLHGVGIDCDKLNIPARLL